MTWVPLDESISAGQAGHITDHESLHASWNNAHVQKVASNLTLDYDYAALVVDSDGAARTITVPAAGAALIDGHVFIVKRTGSNIVKVNLNAADLFDDGSTGKTLATDGATLGMMSVADNVWYISGERGTVT